MELDFDASLEQYYRHLYPVDLITKWLAYGKDITHREIAFISKDDAHLRYQSFAAGEKEFREALIRRRPQKVDIGAVYNRPPRDRKIALGDFFAVERELVFDIDLTDYDSIRTCCREASVCKKCWRWVVVAMRVLEYLLREHFGFQHMLWVFSGRRGVHCWVADERARRIPSRGREAIAKYLAFDSRGSMVTPRRVHQVARDACRVIMQSGQFDALVEEQGWLDDEERWSEVLKLCPEGDARQRLHRAMARAPSSVARLNLLKQAYDTVTREAVPVADRFEQDPRVVHARFFELFVMHYAYPKLDEKVTTGLNHLLKSPFCIHPKTGYVAVPLDPCRVEEFRVEQVPRVDKLWLEIAKLSKSESKPAAQEAEGEGGNKENQTTRRAYLYDSASMAPYVDTFRTFLNAIPVERQVEGGSRGKAQ